MFQLPARDKRYLDLAIPSALEGLFMVLLSSVDIIMVGALGITAIAAVSIFTQPRMMLLCVARSVASALTLLASRAFGAGDHTSALRATGKTLFLTVIVMGVLHILFFIYLEELLRFMGADDSYIALALEYGFPALIGVFLTSVTAVLQALQLGFGQTRAVLSSNFQGNVVNVIGNALFIFGLGPFPELGVAGAAVGTILGTLWSLGITLLYLKKAALIPKEFLPDGAYLKEFMRIFGGVFSEQGFERLGMVLYTRMVAELGPLPYAVHAVCMNFCDIYYSFAGGLGKASMVAAGHAAGARDAEAFKRSLRTGIKWGFIFSVVSCLLTLVFREELFTIYTSDAAALPLGLVVMAICALVSFPEAHALISAGALRGAGYTTEVAVYSFVSIAVLRPIVTYIFIYPLDLGLTGAWLALAFDQSLRALSATYLLRRASRRVAAME